MSMPETNFHAPSSLERVFNRIYGLLVGLGLGFSYNYLLEVRGRKSGRTYSTPIDLLELNGKRYLVAPRGRTQWVRNAEAAGEKPEVLKAYLDTFRREVQQYFPVKAGAPAEAFRAVAQQYPVFELSPL